jgi:hydrogenase expression/formation protein HypE
MMAFKDDIHAMRDPTRGGLATTLKEIATAAALYIEVYEDNIFIPKPVQGACDLFGYDPLYIANEGVLIAFIASKSAESLLNKMKQHPLAINAKIIGQATKSANAKVILHTSIGGKRSLEMLSEGELFPRIC